MYQYKGINPVNILVVDDNRENLYIISHFLKGDDRTILQANTGQEALKIALNNELALILLDVRLPDISGLEVANFLKSNPTTKYVPIIFITASQTESTSVLQGYAEGAVDYLTKPLDIKITKAKVASFITLYKQQKELEQKNVSLENLGMLVNNSADIMCMIVAKNLILEEINPACKTVLDYDVSELKGSCLHSYFSKEDLVKLKKLYPNFDKEHQGTIIHYENKVKCKDGSYIWLSWSAVYKDNHWFANAKDITRQKQAEEALNNAYKDIKQSHQDIQDSIIYAKRIQDATLPSMKLLQDKFPGSFILFEPKDIVSGDFYWFAEVKNKIMLVVADCTGHGVPGALMSMIGNSMLRQIVIEKKIVQPENILKELNNCVKAVFYQHDSTSTHDGMDISICCFDLENQVLQYSGANRPLLRVSNKQLTKWAPNKTAIGGHTPFDHAFTSHTIQLQEGDAFYMFTDGYCDQFGGVNNKKFMTKQFMELLLNLQSQGMQEQKNALKKHLAVWQSTNQQIDDILVIGVQV